MLLALLELEDAAAAAPAPEAVRICFLLLCFATEGEPLGCMVLCEFGLGSADRLERATVGADICSSLSSSASAHDAIGVEGNAPIGVAADALLAFPACSGVTRGVDKPASAVLRFLSVRVGLAAGAAEAAGEGLAADAAAAPA